MTMRRVDPHHQALSDEGWVELLKKSATERVIDGVTFPSFPSAALQAKFVGSSNEASLEDAKGFYKLVKNSAKSLGQPLQESSTLLDFGCGWGRFLRFFWRDVDPENLHGVDVDPKVLEICRETGVQAHLHRVDNRGRLPLPDQSISHAIAYSVFTHLPEHLHLHWLSELARVAKPGCIFVCTTEPRRFLDFIGSIPEDATSTWHQSLRNAAGNIHARRVAFDAGDFVYLPTGGGEFRAKDVYGDAVIPSAYIERHWSPFFALKQYIDDQRQFWQAAVVCRKE